MPRPNARELALNDVKLEDARDRATKSLETFLEANWVFPKIKVPQNGWFMMETHIEMDDLGVPIIFGNTQISNPSVFDGLCGLDFYLRKSPLRKLYNPNYVRLEQRLIQRQVFLENFPLIS